MKSFVAAAMAGCASAYSMVQDARFMDFVAAYGKSYATVEEYKLRQHIWHENDKTINNHNVNFGKNITYIIGHNLFSDWTKQEFMELMGSGHDGTREYANSEEFEHIPHVQPSEEFDWRTKGAVTPVKF